MPLTSTTEASQSRGCSSDESATRVHAVPASAVPTQRLTTDVHERGHCRSLLCVAIRSAPKRSTCADLCIGQVVRHDDELSVWFEQPADAGDETFIEEVVAMFLMIVPSRWLREGHKHTVHGCLFEVVMAKDCRVATEDSQIAQGSEDSALEDGRAAVVAQLERAPVLVPATAAGAAAALASLAVGLLLVLLANALLVEAHGRRQG